MADEINKGMQLVGVEVSHIKCLLEISLEDLKKLKRVLGMVTVDYDGDNPADKELASFLSESFYPRLEEIIKNVQGDG